MKKTYSNNLRLVLKNLYDQKEYKLIRKYCKSSPEIRGVIFKKTDHIKGVSNRYSQRIWHFIHNKYNIPKKPNKTIYGFRNLKDGYSAHKESLFDIYLDSWNLYNAILRPILKHNTNRHKIVKSSVKIRNKIIKETKRLPLTFNIQTRTDYYAHNFKRPRYCAICGNILTNFKHGTDRCSHRCKKSMYLKSKTDMRNYLKKMFYDDHPTAKSLLIREINRNTKLKKFIVSCGNRTFKNFAKPTLCQRIFHIVNKIKTLPKCKVCSKTLTRFNKKICAYPSTCSILCNNKYSHHVEKRLANAKLNKFGYTLNVGKNENTLISMIEQLSKAKLNKDKNITKFFPDAVDEAQRIAYEINEKHHFYQKYYKRDIEKYTVYIEQGYKIFVLWDNPRINKNNIAKLKYLKKKFKENIRFGFYFDPEYKIMTDSGLSNFLGIVKRDTDKNKLMIKLKMGKSVKCTDDHVLFLNDDKMIKASDLKTGSKIKTKDGIVEISDIKKVNDNKAVYDVLQVDNANRFYANGVLVHNCLIIDECAVISTDLFSKFWQAIYPVVSSSKNSSVILVSTPRGVGNFFYETYEAARLEHSKDGWKAYRIDWWDFPGRDEEWKQKQLAAFNGDEVRFGREFGNCGSGKMIVQILDSKTNMKKNIRLDDLYNL